MEDYLQQPVKDNAASNQAIARTNAGHQSKTTIGAIYSTTLLLLVEMIKGAVVNAAW